MRRYRSAHISELRDLPLHVVAAELGYQQSGNDRSKWKSSNSILSINATQFYDHLTLKGGGGAIDLVMHANRCSFKEAVAILDKMATPKPALQSAPSHWEAVTDYLCNQRGLDPQVVENCRRQGLISTDHRKNVRFAIRNGKAQRIGAEIVGTQTRGFKGLSKGVCKQSGSFWLCQSEHQSVAQCRSIMLVESAIDALSTLCLSLPETPELIVSTAGLAYVLPKWLKDETTAARIICGYDADEPAELAAESLAEDPRVVRWLPGNEKDWNDLLVKNNRSQASSVVK